MHLGRPHVIGCWEVDGALVDPGPESSIGTVMEALGDEQPEAILLTHIHLDHAAATGALVRRWPDLEVYVHERGAPHLIDPSKLLASAERLYGDQMQRLWGEIVPVPEANVKVLARRRDGARDARRLHPRPRLPPCLLPARGERHRLRRRRRRLPDPPSRLVVPPTPPPDIDVEVWEESLGLIESWKPERLALTHFGAVEDDVPGYLAEVRSRLREEAGLAREMPQDAYEPDLQRRIRERLTGEGLGEETTAELLQAVPTAYQWSGLDRYWRKRAEREAALS